ncbi:MAG: hypothetical protein Ta2B_20570 [Termitinemataceae bacterium]|nr:MAG: hypothetical protein Ta2B_20570 [Termitinemataceae bacterium]
MKSLKLQFFIIFVLLGAFIAFVGYFPYTNYITRTFQEKLEIMGKLALNEYPEITNIEYIKKITTTVYGISHTEGAQNLAIAGAFGEETQAEVKDFWRLVEGFRNICKSFDGIYVAYVYKKADNEYQYLLSSGFYKSPSEFALLGDGIGVTGFEDLLYPIYDAESIGGDYLLRAEATKQFAAMSNVTRTVDFWGKNLSGYMPVFDSNDNMSGIIHTDISSDEINKMRLRALLMFAISIALAAIASFILATKVSSSLVLPIKEMKKLADALAEERFDLGIASFRKDEMGEMQKSMIKTRDNLKTALSNLKTERDEITAMKDNLRTGVFLMDKDSVIQANYSASLEVVLSAKNLTGKKFTDLLASTFKEKDLQTVLDFIEMVHANKMKQKKLDGINPLSEIAYTSVEDGKNKNLRCVFAALPRNGETYILGTIEDITSEVALKKRLTEKDEQKNDATRTMYEVLTVNLQTFGEFIEDTEYNFERITRLLQDKDVDLKVAAVTIFQLVHATKSDAFILGLLTFGNQLHELEDTIKEIHDSDEVVFEVVLKLTSAVEQILQQKDKMVDLSRMLINYNSDTKGSSATVLCGLLEKASEKVASDLQKKVKFVKGEIDADLLKRVPRREVKEVLMQLVRNSCVHGIETPALRSKAGKSETGSVTLKISEDSGFAVFEVSDDGDGLNYDKIRDKALSLKLISSDDANDEKKLAHVLFMPQMSTAENVSIHAGRGVGLSLVQECVIDMKGTLNVKSTKGGGTTFTIKIPLA